MISRFSLLPILLACLVGYAAETTVEITDEVIVPDVLKLGINASSDSFYDGAILKTRVADNFEGVRYRMISWGPELDEGGVAVFFSPPKEAWGAMEGRVRYTLLSPPNEGVQGTVQGITTKEVGGRELTYIQFDQPVKPSDHRKNGILLELDQLDQGSITNRPNADFWNTDGNTVAIGDTPEETFGQAALHLRPQEGQSAHYAWVPMWPSQGSQNGEWEMSFWAKTIGRDVNLRIDVIERNEETSENRLVKSLRVPESSEWRQVNRTISVSGFADAFPKFLVLRLRVTGGEAMIDDVVISKVEEYENPTAYRDHYVEVLQALSPGVLRKLQMGGSDFANNLKPRLEQVAFTRNFGNLVAGGRNGAENYAETMHDYYELCAYIGADPWYCLPGTIHPEEMPAVMEYLAGPPDSGYGKLRAELGQEEPWTEVFDHIYIEFGNEAWNPGGYATGSFNGPGHWESLIETGRNSPHMSDNIVFVAGSHNQGPNVTRALLQDAPNADTYAIAPYMMNRIKSTQVDHLESQGDLFEWAVAYSTRRVMEPQGNVYQHWDMTQDAGKGLSIYEHSFHWTHPLPGERNAPDVEMRNDFLTSLGAGLVVVNDALTMLKERGVQPQAQFNFSQSQYQDIKLWGFLPGLDIHDQRFRPHFLAQEIAIDVMGGDMVETRLIGDVPMISVLGTWEDTQGREEPVLYENVPTLRAYAFKDGDRRSLILFNLDADDARSVKLALPGRVAYQQANMWVLTAPEVTADNEPETPEPQVKTVTHELGGFGNGAKLTLPPHSMVALEWLSY